MLKISYEYLLLINTLKGYSPHRGYYLCFKINFKTNVRRESYAVPLLRIF